MNAPPTLARRLGKTVHESVLRHKLRRLAAAYPSDTADCLEQWLLDVAYARGARIVVRPRPPTRFRPPDRKTLSNAELITGLCQLQCLDQPQILRPAAQLVSRGDVDLGELKRLTEMERTEPVLHALARLALRIAPGHPVWSQVADMTPQTRPLREPLLHWTRLAQPVMKDGRYNAESWVLVD